MKRHLLYIIALWSLACMVSCYHHYQYPPVLQEADSLCVENPDSAVSLLRAIAGDMQQEPVYVQKRYHLLTIKANDKAYITHTSDSLILSLVDYYEHGGDKACLGEAYYYAGSTYRDLGDAPRALDYYQKALDAMPGDENLKVKSKVYAQMGELFTKQYLYDNAIKSYRLSYQCDVSMNDTVGIIHNLIDLGFAYRGIDKPDTTLQLLEQAYSLTLETNNKSMQNTVTSQLASLYIRLGDLEKAKAYIQPSLEQLIPINASSVFSIAGNIYYNANQLDSAAYYYVRLSDIGNLYARRTAYERLAYIALHFWHDAALTLVYSERYALLQDSIDRITASESISQMDALYNYSLREKENSRLLIRQKNYQLIFTTGIIILLTMILGNSFYVFRNRHKRQLLQSELQKELARNYYFEDYIAQREAVIVEMEREADAVGVENQDLKTEITRQRKLLEDYTISARQTQELASLLPGDLKASPTYKLLQGSILNIRYLNEDESAEIINMMKTYQPKFISHLLQLSQLSQQELLICILTKLNVANKDIASLMAKSESTISTTRSRIYKKLMKTEGGSQKFNELIRSL